MKAIRRSDGKQIEVEPYCPPQEDYDSYKRYSFEDYYITSDKEVLSNYDLDFDLEETEQPEKETVVLEGWICKDGKYFGDGGFLRLFIGSKPYRIVDEEIQSWDGEDSLRLPYILFPSVTWESEPKRVRITIEEIE